MSQEAAETPRPGRDLEEEIGDDAAYAEIARQFGDTDNDEAAENTHDADELPSELAAEYKEFMALLRADPLAPQYAKGEALWIGFDAEWVFDPASQRNHILSIQLYVPEQEATNKDEDCLPHLERLSRLILAPSGALTDRPKLKANLVRLIEDALAWRVIAEPPKLIYVVGFGLRFDLAALGDFGDLKTEVDAVAGRVATVAAESSFEFSRTLATGDLGETILVGLRFIDVAAHVPPGESLRKVGQQVGLPKLDIPAPYSIERMDEYLAEQPEGFRAYAMRDAEIAVAYALRLEQLARKLGIERLPPTASGLALKWCLNTMKDANIDPLAAFGLHRVSYEAYHNPTHKPRIFREVEPTPMRRIQEAFLTDCYAGGRNESFYIGPSPLGHWRDYDLSGAYSTGLMDLPLIDFERPRSTTNVSDYLGHVAGYALIDFEHRADTRFPVFAISKRGRGLIFPRKGTTYATAPEIQAAHDLDCHIVIRWGVVYPWKTNDEGADIRLFRPFVVKARKMRHELKRANNGDDTLESLAAKLYANSVYGKIAQSLRPKNVFDTRQVRTTQLKPSPITNPAIAAHVTGFIRAILAELLNRIPRHRMVLSVTTDGFITDATEDEIDVSGPRSGPLCQRFKGLCDDLAIELADEDGKIPAIPMLEIKHEAKQIVCMKTRGQLTSLPIDGQKIVLARAGVQIAMDAPSNVTGEDYRRLQNAAMLDLYLSRTPATKIKVRQFPSIRDQWEKGIDLHKFTREIRLSLEPDIKRCPVDSTTPTRAVGGLNVSHVALDTRPWEDEAEFDAARASLDGWRREHCLRDATDWQSLKEVLSMSRVRRKHREDGRVTLNLREDRPIWDVLRRAFLRAYAQQALGLVKTMTYQELAMWLSENGFKTEKKEVQSARGQKLATEVVEPLAEVQPLMRLLQEKFPDAELERLLWLN